MSWLVRAKQLAMGRHWGGAGGTICRIAMSGIGLIFVTGFGMSGPASFEKAWWFLLGCAVFAAVAPLVRWGILSMLAGCLMVIVSCVVTHNHIPWDASIAYLGFAVALVVISRRTRSEAH